MTFSLPQEPELCQYMVYGRNIEISETEALSGQEFILFTLESLLHRSVLANNRCSVNNYWMNYWWQTKGNQSIFHFKGWLPIILSDLLLHSQFFVFQARVSIWLHCCLFFSSKHSGNLTVNHFLEEIVFKNSFFPKYWKDDSIWKTTL